MKEHVSYPPVAIRGVPPEKVWRCYNAGNYPYFLRIVHEIITGTCPFCQIDTDLNKIIPIENPSWRVWDNPISKLGGPEAQDFQFVIPMIRHVTHHNEVTREEWGDLFDLIRAIDTRFEISGGAVVARWGNPLRCARSQEHFHFNYHVPTGKTEVRPWIAKSADVLARKQLILEAFEMMRLIQISQRLLVDEAHALLPAAQRELVAGLLDRQGRC